MYVDLALAKEHLRIEPEYTGQDRLILQYIAQAELMVELDIHEDLSTFEDGEGKLPKPLEGAILLLMATYYNSEGNIAFGVIKQELPMYDHIISKYRNYSK